MLYEKIEIQRNVMSYYDGKSKCKSVHVKNIDFTN